MAASISSDVAREVGTISHARPNLQGRKISAGGEKHSQTSSIGMAIKITIPTKIMLSTLFLNQFFM